MRAVSLLAVVATLLLPIPALCVSPEPERSGDGLWDAYAQLLDNALTRQDLEQAVAGFKLHALNQDNAWLLPKAPFQELALIGGEKLDGLESRFADDPRYWQLRYFEALRNLPLMNFDHPGEEEALDWLRKGKARGATDYATDWILCRVELAKLRRSADDAGWSDVEPRIRQVLDDFVAKYPDQSLAHYERAMFSFELGDWDEGLAELEAGNSAAHNDCPQIFPASFIVERAESGGPVGSQTAAGIVAIQWGALPLQFDSDSIKWKDHIKEEQARIGLGAPFSEIGPWHRFACRMSTQKGGLAINGLMGAVFDGIMVGSLFVDDADSFTVRQRENLRVVDGQIRTYRTNISVGLAKVAAEYPMADSLLGLDPDRLQDQFRNGWQRCAHEVQLIKQQGQTMDWLYKIDLNDLDHELVPELDLPQNVSFQ